MVSPHHRLLRVGRGFNRVGFKSVSGVCGCSRESQVQAIGVTNEVFTGFDDLRWNPKSSPMGNGRRRTRSVPVGNQPREAIMKSGLRDQVEGAAKEAKGATKQKISKVTGDPPQAAEGAVEEAKGKFQKKTGEIKRDVMRD
jgi:uncharacterized protein YjbJ (UPF0337 family)